MWKRSYCWHWDGGGHMFEPLSLEPCMRSSGGWSSDWWSWWWPSLVLWVSPFVNASWIDGSRSSFLNYSIVRDQAWSKNPITSIRMFRRKQDSEIALREIYISVVTLFTNVTYVYQNPRLNYKMSLHGSCTLYLSYAVILDISTPFSLNAGKHW